MVLQHAANKRHPSDARAMDATKVKKEEQNNSQDLGPDQQHPTSPSQDDTADDEKLGPVSSGQACHVTVLITTGAMNYYYK